MRVYVGLSLTPDERPAHGQLSATLLAISDAATIADADPARRSTGRDRPRERLWTSHEDLLDRFHLESVPSPSGVTHLLFWRR